MGKSKWTVFDGPLEGSVFALDAESCDEGRDSIDINFKLPDGRVAVYRTTFSYKKDILKFVGIDPFA